MTKIDKHNSLITNERQRFSLRKLSVGLASVFLGTSIYMMSSQTQVAKADTITNDPQDTQLDSSNSNDSDDLADEHNGVIATKVSNNQNETESKDDATNTSTVDNQNNLHDSSTTNTSSTSTDTNNTEIHNSDSNDSTNKPNNNQSINVPVSAKTDTSSSMTKSVSDLTFTYDNDTDTLTISPNNGTAVIESGVKESLFGQGAQYADKVKHINITGKIVLKDDAAMYLFSNLSKLVDITGLDNLDLSMSINVHSMFAFCTSLTSLNLNSFITTSITDMGSMFDGCTNLNSVNIDKFNTQNVQLMDNMFRNCANLSSVNLSNFNTSKVRYFLGMFQGCSKMTTLDLTNFDMSAATALPNMLADMPWLKVIKLGPKVKLNLGFNNNAGLNSVGAWLKQGTGTLTDPMDMEGLIWNGVSSTTLMDNFDDPSKYPANWIDTYILSWRYYFTFIDDDPNAELNEWGSVSELGPRAWVRIVSTQLPDGVYPGHGLSFPMNDSMKKQVKDIEAKNYKLNADQNLFGPDGNSEFVPTVEQSVLNEDAGSVLYVGLPINFLHKTTDESETVDRTFTVHYVDSNGKKVAPDTVQSKKFTRTKTTDLVTNKITLSDWTTEDEHTTEVKVPVMKGYVADKNAIPSQTMTADKDIETTVTYKQLGNYVPVDKNGKAIPGTTKTPYENDPNDPTKIVEKIPKIDGYTPSKDTQISTDLSKDTNVVMLKDNKTTISFIDEDSNNIPIGNVDNIVFSNEIGKEIVKPAGLDEILKKLDTQGYYLATDPLKNPVIATEGDQFLKYEFKHKIQDGYISTMYRKQVIHYVDENGVSLASDYTFQQEFTVVSNRDLVTGGLSNSIALPNATTFDPIPNPVISGYITTDKEVPVKQLGITDSDTETTVIYKKLGSFIPVDKNGNAIPNVDKIQYENAPDDPTKINEAQILPPIDGYEVPDIFVPKDVTKDSPIRYLAKNQTSISFVDQDNNNQRIDGIDDIVLGKMELDSTITKPANVDTILKTLADKGYVLVTDPFATNVTAVEGPQVIKYVFKHKLASQSETTTRKQTIHYVDNNGNKLADDKVTNVRFNRIGSKDLVTGNITWNSWSADQTLPKVKNPVINGYITDNVEVDSQKISAEKDIETTVTYKQLGSYVPVDKNGNAIPGATKVQYKNDPNDPTKVNAIQSLPTINGYETPKASIPADVTKDTSIVYLEKNQTSISFVDQDNNNQTITGVDDIVGSNEIGKTISKSPEIDKIVNDLLSKGYELVSDPFKEPVIATDGQQVIKYVFKHKIDNTQSETVTRKQIIHFVDKDGNKLADDKVTEGKFTRTGKKDLVTGIVEWTDWSANQTLPEVKVPVVKGYITDKKVIVSQTITPDKDIESTVTYQKLGGYIPVDKNGNAIPGTSKVPYENDPNDPTKILDKLPKIDGHTPKDINQKPDNPLEDTNVTYYENNKTVISFVDQDNSNQKIDGISDITSSNEIGKTITKPIAIDKILADLAAKGYELVTDPFTETITASDGQQVIKYVFKHKIDDTQSETVTRKQTIHFVDKDGNKLADDKVTEAKFTRTGKKDLVTGKITWTNWSKDQELPEVKVPVVKGYITDKKVIASQTITAANDIESTVTYQKLGGYIPVDKNGNRIPGTNKIPYENDPNDPTKISTTLPTINGYVPSADAKLPTDATKDTSIVYLENNQTIISFVDQDNNNQKITGINDIISSNEINKEIKKPANIDKIINDLLGKGYELVTDPFTESITATTGQQVIKYVFKHKIDNTQSDTVTKQQVIHFVDKDGNKLADDKVTEVKFTRTGKKDLVTGEVTWTDWSKEQVLPEVKVPVIKGYLADRKTIASQTITADKYVPSTTVTYQKLGGYVPVDKNGNVIPGINKVPYENDPDDPTKIKADQVLPTINGKITPKAPLPDDATKDSLVTYQDDTSGTSTGNSDTTPDDKVPDNPTTPDDKPENPDDPDNKPKKPVSKKPKKVHNNNSKPLSQIKTNNAYPAAAIDTQAIKDEFEHSLPQTGSQQTDAQVLIALGMFLLGLSLPFKPKRKDDI